MTDQDTNGQSDRLNRGCFCITLDRRALAKALDREVGNEGFAETFFNSHPTLFANVPFLPPHIFCPFHSPRARLGEICSP